MVLLAVHALLDPDAVLPSDRAVFVGEQRERQGGLLGELLVRLRAVAADAVDLGALLAQLLPRVAETAGLGGAAGVSSSG